MTKNRAVILTAAAAALAFALGWAFYEQPKPAARTPNATPHDAVLMRPHSPIMGRADAPVTVVEVFDPSCETCRAFYPAVKQLLADYPKDVRVIIRYAPFHEGSDEAVRILEAARLQGKFDQVLQVLIDAQPSWAVHGAPDLGLAWQLAGGAGLDLERARRDARKPVITDVLTQDLADIRAVGVRQTPAFFVNGKPLPRFGIEELKAFVGEEVERYRRTARN